MLQFSARGKYSARPGTLKAIIQSLAAQFSVLPDTRMLWIASTDPVLDLPTLCDQIQVVSQTGSSDRANSYFGLPADAGDMPQDTYAFCTHLCELPLQDWQTEAQLTTPVLVAVGLSDRLNVVLQAQLAEEESTPLRERNYLLQLSFDPQVCTEVQQWLMQQFQGAGETAILTLITQSLQHWPAAQNDATLQSELTLQWLSVLSDTEHSPELIEAGLPTSGEALSDEETIRSFHQRPWLQQERLLQELLHIDGAILGPQVIIRRSAEVIRAIFGVSRCQIVFFSAEDYRVGWGAIAHAPEFLSYNNHPSYPDWQTVQGIIQRHRQASTWVTAEPLPRPLRDRPIEIPLAKAILSSWTQPDTQGKKKWIAGFLSIEQWDRPRIWQPEEMYLLHTAIHQVEQGAYQALLYQQVEERAQRTALLNQLIAQMRASLDLAQIFETVTSALGQLVIIDQCCIIQFNQDHCWEPVVEYRLTSDVPSALGRIIADRENPYSPQLHVFEAVQVSDTRHIDDPAARTFAEKHGSAWLAVPIHRGQELWGCISFNQYNYPRYWHESEVEFLTIVADHLAIAIHQATLYQQIQDQKQNLELQVAQRTAELESFFDAHPDYIFVLERNTHRLPFCNHAFAHSVGFENRQQVQGKSVRDCLPPASAESFLQRNQQVFNTGQVLHEQEAITLSDGVHYFDTFKVPLCNPNGEIYALLGTARDITELINTREALAERTTQLQDALTAAQAASQAKSEFLATMSHELRTPLTSVIGMSSALLKQFLGSLNPKQAEYLQLIHSSGAHLLNLINDILDLAKIEAGKASLQVSQFSLRRIADESIDWLSEKARRQEVTLIKAFDDLPSEEFFWGDERRVKQILLNLLSNAVKFTTAGGKIWLRIIYDEGLAQIEVEDTGIGIPDDKQHLLFEAFQQIDSSLNRQHEGTGLGLALTRQLTEMHGGTIQFRSVVGQGTIFIVRLPSQRHHAKTVAAGADAIEEG